MKLKVGYIEISFVRRHRLFYEKKLLVPRTHTVAGWKAQKVFGYWKRIRKISWMNHDYLLFVSWKKELAKSKHTSSTATLNGRAK